MKGMTFSGRQRQTTYIIDATRPRNNVEEPNQVPQSILN